MKNVILKDVLVERIGKIYESFGKNHGILYGDKFVTDWQELEDRLNKTLCEHITVVDTTDGKTFTAITDFTIKDADYALSHKEEPDSVMDELDEIVEDFMELCDEITNAHKEHPDDDFLKDCFNCINKTKGGE